MNNTFIAEVLIPMKATAKLLFYTQPKVHSRIWEGSLLTKQAQIKVQRGVLVHHNVRTQDRD